MELFNLVTGAAFVVFNGALKTNLTMNAKQSVIEDGIMIQIDTEMMSKLKQSLQSMKPFRIECSQVVPDESVINIEWTKENKHINKGVLSVIDEMPMMGIKSIRLANTYDYVNDNKSIRWNEIFLIKIVDDTPANAIEESNFNLNRFAEMVSQASCSALAPLLNDLSTLNVNYLFNRTLKGTSPTSSSKLAQQDNNNNHLSKQQKQSQNQSSRPFKIAVRIDINRDKVGYLFGMNGQPISDAKFLSNLDNELIHLLHQATNYNVIISIELVFIVQERFNSTSSSSQHHRISRNSSSSSSS